MSRYVWLITATMGLASLAGCRCCPLFNPYASVLDDIGDVDLVSDRWYNPRFDISRAGRPDWCGPINSFLCPCLCFQGSYQRYDDCWLYPPSYPYAYPSQTALYSSGAEPLAPKALPTTEPVTPQDLEPTSPGLIPPPPPPA